MKFYYKVSVYIFTFNISAKMSSNIVLCVYYHCYIVIKYDTLMFLNPSHREE